MKTYGLKPVVYLCICWSENREDQTADDYRPSQVCRFWSHHIYIWWWQFKRIDLSPSENFLAKYSSLISTNINGDVYLSPVLLSLLLTRSFHLTRPLCLTNYYYHYCNYYCQRITSLECQLKACPRNKPLIIHYNIIYWRPLLFLQSLFRVRYFVRTNDCR